MDADAIARLVDAEASAHDQIATRAVADVSTELATLDDWYDHAAIAVAAARAGEVARAASRAAVALTDAYITRVLTEMLGRQQRGAGAMDVTLPLRMGVSSWGAVYGRVADTVRFQVSKGRSVEDAVQIALKRADAMVQTDLGLARRDQWNRSVTANPRTTGYRRVVHPELSRTGTCGLCIAAADRVYSRDTLLPLHARCRCTVLPITASHDPGGTLNQKSFAEAYELAGSTRARELKEVRVRYEWNSELGPRLANAEHRSTNPGRNRTARAATGRAQVRRPDTRRSSQAAFQEARRNLASGS